MAGPSPWHDQWVEAQRPVTLGCDSTAKHRALVYRDADRFIDAVGAFVRDGVERGESVLTALSAEKLDWLRHDLGADAPAVDFADERALYERHGPMLASVLDYLERHGTPGGGRVRIVAEQALALRDPADVRAYMRYEAASNVAYARFDANVLCPYDAASLPDAIVRDALRTHPEVLDDGAPRPSERYVDPRSFVRERAVVERVPAGVTPIALELPDDVAGARAFARAHAEAAGAPTEAIEDLELAVSEVATNALVHGRGPRLVWCYVDHGDLVCRVHDAGPGPADPLQGYLPPDIRRLRGRGLWLAHQLCDIVEIAGDRAGTDVQLRLKVGRAA
jgi:anti-sigma regulatory factor (Ser/Thr protein kinase)